jgi:hypothetical protein
MISHANIEIGLAAKIKELLTTAITGLSHADVWYSEDSGALEYTGDFFNQILTRMNECKVVVSIQSPISKARPWPLWECGNAFGQDKGPYIFTFAAKQSIRGRLGTPLDFQQQCDGTNADQVDEIVTKIKDALRDDLNPKHREFAEKFVESSAELVAETRDAEVAFDRRLLITATSKEFATIVREGIMPDGVKVIADPHTFNAFGYAPASDETEIEWSKFAEYLKQQESPWPNSSVRWANTLVRVLQKARDNRLIQDAEALPLYYSPALSKSLRPALTKRSFRGSKIEFEITFVDLPPELVERPVGDLGILFHYLDLGRMLRWGVLESSSVVDLRIRASIPAEELQSIIKQVLTRILNIRTDFFNRGLQKDSLLQAVGEQDSGLVIELMQQYNVLMDKIDPLDGMLGKKIPDRSELLGYLDEMLGVNKKFMDIVATNISEKVKRLPVHYTGNGARQG